MCGRPNVGWHRSIPAALEDAFDAYNWILGQTTEGRKLFVIVLPEAHAEIAHIRDLAELENGGRDATMGRHDASSVRAGRSGES